MSTHSAAAEQTEQTLQRLDQLVEIGMALARIVGRKAQEEAEAEAARLDGVEPAAGAPAPSVAEPPRREPRALSAAAPAASVEEAPSRPSGLRRIGWMVLFLRISREVRRLVALEAGIDAAGLAAALRPAAFRPAASPASSAKGPEDPRRARIRTLVREAAEADPQDRDLASLLRDVDALLAEDEIEVGLAAGDAVADLAADICEDLGIPFDFDGLPAEDLLTRDDPAPLRPDPKPD